MAATTLRKNGVAVALFVHLVCGHQPGEACACWRSLVRQVDHPHQIPLEMCDESHHWELGAVGPSGRVLWRRRTERHLHQSAAQNRRGSSSQAMLGRASGMAELRHARLEALRGHRHQLRHRLQVSVGVGHHRVPDVGRQRQHRLVHLDALLLPQQDAPDPELWRRSTWVLL